MTNYDFYINTIISGFSLFDLKLDPLELVDLGRDKKLSYKRAQMSIVTEINNYFNDEVQKGFKLPITGKLRGKLLSLIVKKGMSKEERTVWFLETGRLIDFSRKKIIGTIGTNWCPAESDYMQLYMLYVSAANATGNNNRYLEYLLNLYLFDGFGPDGYQFGKSRMINDQPHSRSFQDNFYDDQDDYED